MSTKMVLLGKVKHLPKEVEFRSFCEYQVVMNVYRNFQNIDGYYDVDEMSVYLYRGAAETIIDVLKVGDHLQIIGRFETNENNEIILFGEQIDLIRN